MTAYDAIIVGAGPAGATAALALARARWSVALIEKAPYPRRKVCGEFISATNAALLRELGLDIEIRQCAGPEIRRVGLFAGSRIVTAPMPQLEGTSPGWGFAMARETLDALLVRRAAKAGATILMPWRAIAFERAGIEQRCTIVCGAEKREIYAPVVILAHGSWDPGALPTQTVRSHRPRDLLAFKIRFHGATLDPDLMPLIVFPGGYGGMVSGSGDRLSLTCCIRRDALQALRLGQQGGAAAAVLAHLRSHCRGVAETLRDAVPEAPALAAGPIAPGIRSRYAHGQFRVGNAAGEAHPIVAEGISMAMQSGWLLARLLTGGGGDPWRPHGLDAVAAAYTKQWRRCFATRIYAAALFASLLTKPSATALLTPLITRFPALLTYCAKLSGKTSVEWLQ